MKTIIERITVDEKICNEVCILSEQNKLVNVFKEHIEGIN